MTIAQLRQSVQHLYYGWYLAAASAMIILVAAGVFYYGFGLLVDPLRAEFGWSALAVGAAVVFTYTVAGGLYAAIWTDFVQIYVAIGGFLLLAGWLLDRFDRHRVMALDNAIRGLAVAAIPFLGLLGLLEVWHVYLAAGVHGLLMMISLAGTPQASVAWAFPPVAVNVSVPAALATNSRSLAPWEATSARKELISLRNSDFVAIVSRMAAISASPTSMLRGYTVPSLSSTSAASARPKSFVSRWLRWFTVSGSTWSIQMPRVVSQSAIRMIISCATSTRRRVR